MHKLQNCNIIYYIVKQLMQDFCYAKTSTLIMSNMIKEFSEKQNHTPAMFVRHLNVYL